MPSTVWQTIARFDKWQATSAWRCAIGVALPLIVGAVTNHYSAGVLAALGALYAGIIGANGVYHVRARAMMLSGALTATTTLLGTLVGRSDLGSTLAVASVAFAAALLAGSSQTASSVAVQCTAVLIVLSGLKLDRTSALGNAGLVLAGAVTQVGLLGIVWPFRAKHVERRPVADVFDSLAFFVRSLPAESEAAIPASGAIQDARRTIDEAMQHGWREEHVALQLALDRAETLRAALVAFARADSRFRSSGPEATEEATIYASRLAELLEDEAARIRRGGTLIKPDLAIHDEALPEDYAKWLGFIGRAVWHEDAESGCEPSSQAPDPFRLLPESPALRDTVFRHAFRYGAAVTLGEAVVRVLPVSHGYWLPLTICIVLRQDYATTYTRGLARLLGTVGGVLLMTGFDLVFHPLPLEFSALVVGASWFMFAFFSANYAAYSAAVTVYVISSVAASGFIARDAALGRVAATIIGFVIAVLAYRLWPVWQRRQLWAAFEPALQSQFDYGQKLLDFLAGTDPCGASELRPKARLYRLQCEALVQSVSVEPGALKNPDVQAADDALRVLDGNAAEFLVLHAEGLIQPERKDELMTECRRITGASEALLQEVRNRLAVSS